MTGASWYPTAGGAITSDRTISGAISVVGIYDFIYEANDGAGHKAGSLFSIVIYNDIATRDDDIPN